MFGTRRIGLLGVSLLLQMALTAPLLGVAFAEDAIFWEIGTSDNNASEFALAPGNFLSFGEDPIFAVGLSDAKEDWPYVQPGPIDMWAGYREHTSSILFGLEPPPSGGECQLLIDLVDTHADVPPQLRIEVNGHASLHQTPGGAGDLSIHGDSASGREHSFTVAVPCSQLRAGENRIDVTTISGSWVLYDSIGFRAPDNVILAPLPSTTLVSGVQSPPVLIEKDGRLQQILRIDLTHFGEPCEAEVVILREGGKRSTRVKLESGKQHVEVPLETVDGETDMGLDLVVQGKTVAHKEVVVKPVRRWEVYLLPHSHVDIGYTNVQTQVERDHWSYYEQAIQASRDTADYPPGAQYKWNVEVLWSVDSYLNQASPEKKDAFIEAVKAGRIGLDALYGNELTALCRPEELVRLVDYAERLERRCGVEIDSAMISDVPGYTWGIVPVLAQSGVKYFSVVPNGGARIGFTGEAWRGKPFYWVSPCGQYKVLCWMSTSGGYVHPLRSEEQMFRYLEEIERSGYPYDIVQKRDCVGDNGGPSLGLSDLVRDWNEKYAYPKLIISTASEMFSEFEHRYGDTIPSVRGDFTPYWEDGAASSARETAINRGSAERLAQAETLWAMTDPENYPADEFYEAWRNVLLYDEHTWGAHNSISEPDRDNVKSQWKIKQGFALDAERQSHELLNSATRPADGTDEAVQYVDVWNTSSWPRTDLVILPKGIAGGIVIDGTAVAPRQWLSNEQLAFVAYDIPAFGSKRYSLNRGMDHVSFLTGAKAEGNEISNGKIHLAIDKKTGAISSLTYEGIDFDLVDSSAGIGLNDYFYVVGTDPTSATRNGPVKITVKENGPIVTSLLIESDAPGCRNLSREISVTYGIDRVDIINTVDKERVRTKEGVHFAFPFNVPDGVMRMDIPWAVARPEIDQITGSCKNWFTVQRWVDVSNEDYGVTWATVDAPLVEVGAITAEIPWIRTLEPTQTLYSYVMNNYWFTNYRSDQEGPTTFRYSIKPHGRYKPSEAARFGIEQSQPLVVVPVGEDSPKGPADPLLSVEPENVMVATLKPSNDRQARIVRLFNTGEHTEKVSLNWSEPAPKDIWISNPAEEKVQKVSEQLSLKPLEFISLRIDDK